MTIYQYIWRSVRRPPSPQPAGMGGESWLLWFVSPPVAGGGSGGGGLAFSVSDPLPPVRCGGGD